MYAFRTLSIIAFALAGVTAHASNCEIPRTPDADLRPVISCLSNEIVELKREQSRLRRQLEDQALSLREIPGEYRNENGVVSRSPNRNLQTASFILTSRHGNSPASLPIAQNVIRKLCAGEEGCFISLILRREGIGNNTPQDVIVSGPCLFDYDTATGNWSRGVGCGESTPAQGRDGNGSATGDDGAETIAVANGGCILADSDPRTIGVQAHILGRDHAKGLFIIAAPSLRENGEGRFRCELKIE